MYGDAKPHPKITERQREILEMLDRRVPIKVIASELSISESRVNQHIRTLKQAFDASDLSQLVARYRSATLMPPAAPCRKPAYRNNHLQCDGGTDNRHVRVADGEFVLSDVQPLTVDAPWSRTKEPLVVPGALDGRHAVIHRLALMLAMAVGVVAVLVLVILGAQTVGNVVDGMAKVPANGTEKAG